MVLDELLRPVVRLELLLGGSVGKFLHFAPILGALHASPQHAQGGLQRHRFCIVLVHFGCGFGAGNGRICNEASVWNFSLDVHVHGAVHDDDHGGHAADHELVVIEDQGPVGNELKMALHVTGCSSNGFELAHLPIRAGNPAAQVHLHPKPVFTTENAGNGIFRAIRRFSAPRQ